MVGSHGAQKPAPASSPPRQGEAQQKYVQSFFSISQKRIRGPQGMHVRNWKKNTFCPPRWKWPRLTTSWHLKEGFTLNVVHHADELSVVYEKKERGKKDYPTTYVPERTFHNVRSGRPPVPTERTKAMTLPTCWWSHHLSKHPDILSKEPSHTTSPWSRWCLRCNI